MTLSDFLTMPLAKRIAWLHSEHGPEGKLSHDRFAERLGTSRQVVISWENGVEPSEQFRRNLAAFSGFPAEAFSRREAERLFEATIGSRLGELEELVANLVQWQAVVSTDVATLGTRLATLEEERERRRAKARRRSEVNEAR